MFQKIDWFFLLHFEKGCHALQRLTGKTNWYYAALCNFLVTLILLGGYFGIFPKALLGENGLVLGILLRSPLEFWFVVFFNSFLSLVYKITEQWEYDQLNTGVANIYKVELLCRFCRLQILALSPFVLLLPIPDIQIYDKAFFVLLVLWVFLISCDPLPPCKGKVKEWLKSFGKKPALAVTKT